MVEPSLLERARQGEPEAIAILLNQQLRAQGLTATVAAQAGCLRIWLTGERVPPQPAATEYLRRAFERLQAAGIHELAVSGQVSQSDRIVWQAIVPLAPLTPAPATPTAPEPTRWVAPPAPATGFLLLWVLATVVGGWLGQATVLRFITDNPGLALALGIGDRNLFLSGVSLGFAQWLLLRRQLSQAIWWIPATAFGWWLAAIARALIMQLLQAFTPVAISTVSPTWLASFHWQSIPYAAGSGLLVGLSLSSLQSGVLWRSRLAWSSWWQVSIAAWTLGTGLQAIVAYLGARLPIGLPGSLNLPLLHLLAPVVDGLGILLGLVAVGRLTGPVLMALFAESPATGESCVKTRR